MHSLALCPTQSASSSQPRSNKTGGAGPVPTCSTCSGACSGTCYRTCSVPAPHLFCWIVRVAQAT